MNVTRRNAIAGIGAGGLGAALAARGVSVSAQDAKTDLSDHPIVGMWLTGRSPGDFNVTHWAADGTMTVSGNIASIGQDGKIAFSNIPMGTWEPEGERGIHFTFTLANFDNTGAYTGTGTVDGHPVASEDGQTFWDDGKKVTVTVRDATGAVVVVLGEDGSIPAIGGIKMVPGNAGYDELLALLASKQTATPTS